MDFGKRMTYYYWNGLTIWGKQDTPDVVAPWIQAQKRTDALIDHHLESHALNIMSDHEYTEYISHLATKNEAEAEVFEELSNRMSKK